MREGIEVDVKDIPEFVNRERELKQFRALLSGRPNLIYFVYGPINSGKTALLMKLFEELSEDYWVFYINFRGRYVTSFEDLLKVLFEVRIGTGKKKIKDIVREVLKGGAQAVEKFKGVPIPEKIFDYLFSDSRKVEDVFRYLEDVFEEVVRRGYRPILVLDEMQSIKEVINAAGRQVISELFNFMVRLTKETHLCHCLCATSDCLFIEDVYSNARLEGRAEYILVDDLDKEEAFRVYEEFGFEEKELVWDYIGGKFGDMIKLFERKKRGISEKDALLGMLKDEAARLKWIRLKNLKKREDGKEIWKFLLNFKNSLEIAKRIEEEDFEKLLFWVEENVVFYNPLDGSVRLQSRLLWHAIREVV